MWGELAKEERDAYAERAKATLHSPNNTQHTIAKCVHPLQHWALARPGTMTSRERLAQWKTLTPAERIKFGVDSKMARMKACGCHQPFLKGA